MWVALPVMLISLLQSGMQHNIHLPVHSLASWARTSTIGFCASQAAADTLIAAMMIVLLHRRRTGFSRFPRTDRVIKILIRYAIHTGAVTSVVALTILISFLWYDGYHFLTMSFVVVSSGITFPPLHARSHARRRLLPGSREGVAQSIHLSKISTTVRLFVPRGFLFGRRQDAN
ncbi:uncharacterized protein EI90DRAFT_3041404 [Cantharellus anzutake]|uniref:uncharacterized protein n=1 Tax=Cantharellus anzutake TaxID=1750568 RepID=UPI001903A9AC|nr:uncharacterized protein EI90DRAFT_3041404 [Cantharellus anzutake]KAF8338044.1 hypothetical protein EI90DRAFT_3041404 [Cantharellus anzutake]